ncbi:MAG TPA: hypothetical protein VLV86_04225 [Vicinamibacterales bacterium]|nr:hypothetical protein [Vicinamibacterales bacterium]
MSLRLLVVVDESDSTAKMLTYLTRLVTGVAEGQIFVCLGYLLPAMPHGCSSSEDRKTLARKHV